MKAQADKGRIQFVVAADGSGDFTPEYINDVILEVAAWYASPECNRKYDNPLEMAKRHVEQCLLCETGDGRAWKRAPNTFETRVLQKCNYDIENKAGVSRGGIVSNTKQRIINPEAKKGVQAMQGQNPVTAAFDADVFRQKFEEELLSDYPELDNAAHRPHVTRLSLNFAQQKLIDIELSLGTNAKQRATLLSDLETLEKMAERTMKLLDIHPDSLRKRVDRQQEGTFSELVSVLEDDKEFLERERLWALQAALQLWWMTQHDNGKGDGPQLEAWELWHATRCKEIRYTCECGKAVILVDGFTPQELHDYLVKRGVLVYKPIKPLVPDNALDGMEQYFTTSEEVPEAEEVADEPSEG